MCIVLARGGAAAARRAHNPKVRGSNPLPATKDESTSEPRPARRGSCFLGGGLAVSSRSSERRRQDDQAFRRTEIVEMTQDAEPGAGAPSTLERVNAAGVCHERLGRRRFSAISTCTGQRGSSSAPGRTWSRRARRIRARPRSTWASPGHADRSGRRACPARCPPRGRLSRPARQVLPYARDADVRPVAVVRCAPRRPPDLLCTRHRSVLDPGHARADHDSRRASRDAMTSARLECTCQEQQAREGDSLAAGPRRGLARRWRHPPRHVPADLYHVRPAHASSRGPGPRATARLWATPSGTCAP